MLHCVASLDFDSFFFRWLDVCVVTIEMKKYLRCTHKKLLPLESCVVGVTVRVTMNYMNRCNPAGRPGKVARTQKWRHSEKSYWWRLIKRRINKLSARACHRYQLELELLNHPSCYYVTMRDEFSKKTNLMNFYVF